MTTRALHRTKDSTRLATTINRLFRSAFHSSEAVYRRESLMGWRPLRLDETVRKGRPGNKPAPRNDTPAAHPPGVTIRETDDQVVIEVELPWIKADSLYIEISGDLLIIRGEREAEKAKAPGDSPVQAGERMVHRYIQLPMIARPGEVRARLDGNTVRVNISKRAHLR
jgi:HSP20 family molecular chaperone IbpA